MMEAWKDEHWPDLLKQLEVAAEIADPRHGHTRTVQPPLIATVRAMGA